MKNEKFYISLIELNKLLEKAKSFNGENNMENVRINLTGEEEIPYALHNVQNDDYYICQYPLPGGEYCIKTIGENSEYITLEHVLDHNVTAYCNSSDYFLG